MRILELINMYINKIKSEGIKEYVFDEEKRMAIFNFDNITKSTALSYSTNLCSRLSRLKYEEEIPDLLFRPYSYEIFDPVEIKKRLDMMTPEKCIVFFISKNVEK